MKNSLDVARYFLRRLDREAGDTISPLKLQKLLYYVQAWSLVLREKPLFSEAIEAWVSGPPEDIPLSEMRIDRKKRIFGLRIQAIYYIVWFDRDHSVCPENKTRK